jgi:hypothetical protein
MKKERENVETVSTLRNDVYPRIDACRNEKIPVGEKRPQSKAIRWIRCTWADGQIRSPDPDLHLRPWQASPGRRDRRGGRRVERQAASACAHGCGGRGARAQLHPATGRYSSRPTRRRSGRRTAALVGRSRAATPCGGQQLPAAQTSPLRRCTTPPLGRPCAAAPDDLQQLAAARASPL